MTLRLLAEQHLEFLSLKRGFTSSSESTLAKMLHFWKSHVAAHIYAKLKIGVPLYGVALQEEGPQIPRAAIRRIISSMPVRCRTCVAACVCHT